jgi:hypothetical protein
MHDHLSPALQLLDEPPERRGVVEIEKQLSLIGLADALGSDSE